MKTYSLKIKRYYDVVQVEDLKIIDNLLHDRSWTMQRSGKDGPKTFFESVLTGDEYHLLGNFFGPVLINYLEEHNISVSNTSLERSYINCHPCYHPGGWHIDNDVGITMLYYPLSNIDFGNEGATDFKNLEKQLYIGNSILIFPANLLHMATEHSHKGELRYTFAFKFTLD
jgi:hypothetical protein